MADHAEANRKVFGKSDDEMVNGFEQSQDQLMDRDSEENTRLPEMPDEGGSMGILLADQDGHTSDSSSDDTLSEDDSELNAEVEGLVASHEKYKDDLANQRKQHEKAMALREKEFAEERIGLQETLEMKHEALIEENARKNAQLKEYGKANEKNLEAEREQCNQKLYEQQQQFDERLRTELEKKDQAIERLVIEHGNEVDAVRNRVLDENRTLRSEIEELREKVRIAKEKTSMTAKDKLCAVAKIAELSKDMKEMEAELTRVKTKMVEQDREHQASLNQLKKEQQEHHRIDRENCQMKAELKALERQLDDEKKSHTLTKQALARNSNISSDVSMKCVVDAHAQLEEDMKDEMRVKEERYQRRIDELQQSVEEARKGRYEDLEEKHEMDLKCMEDNFERQREEMITAHRCELDALEKKLIDAGNESSKDKDKLVREIRNLQQKLKQMKTERKEVQGSLKAKVALCDQQEGYINGLKKELGQAQNENKALVDQNAADFRAAEKRHEGELARKEEEMIHLRQELEQKMRDMEAEHSAKQEEAKAVLDKREETHRAKIEKERQAHAEHLQEARHDKDEALRQATIDAKDREQLMKNEHDRLIQHLKGEIADHKEQLEKVREKLEKEQGERRKEMLDAKETERRNREEFEAKIKKTIEDNQANIEEQKTGYENRLREMNEKLEAESTMHEQALQDERTRAEKERYNVVNAQTETYVKSENASREERQKKDEEIEKLKEENWRLKSLIPPEKKKTSRRLSLPSFRKNRKGSQSSQGDTINGSRGGLLEVSYEGPCDN